MLDGIDFTFFRSIWLAPLPLYIKRPVKNELDLHRYQTVYSREKGSVAAPTAGLHFTFELLEPRLKAKISRFNL